MAEFLTPENAIPQPLGFFGRTAQGATIVGSSAFGKTPTLMTKAGQSFTELGSSLLTPTSVSPSGQLVFAPDKTQRIIDFATTGSSLSVATGKQFNLGTFKTIYSTKYPNLDWSSGKVITTSGMTGGTFSLMSVSPTSTAISVFLPKGASPTSANIQAFIPRVQSVSSVGSWYSPSSLSRSLSSFSSSSSSFSSSSSSVSSLSSSSSSSFSSSSSSVSSLSSSSSSSSSSSISSISGGAGILIPPIPWLPSGSYDYTKNLKRIFGKRKYKYTPSYEALIFNIRGKIPKGIETGARIRPIPKGFKWFETKFKIPAFNLSNIKKTKRRKKR